MIPASPRCFASTPFLWKGVGIAYRVLLPLGSQASASPFLRKGVRPMRECRQQSVSSRVASVDFPLPEEGGSRGMCCNRVSFTVIAGRSTP